MHSSLRPRREHWLLLLVAVVGACDVTRQTVGFRPGGDVPPPGYDFRARVRFDNRTQLAEDLVDFPALVVLDVPALLAETTASEFGALAFVDPDTGAALPHEVEGEWDSGGKNSVWVRIPRIAADSDENFVYLYFGGESPLPAADSVFETHWSGVFHMTGNSLRDSSARGNDGEDAGSTITAGVVGDARYFDGTGSALIGSSGFPDGASPFSVCAWLAPGTEPANLGGYFYALSFGSPATDEGFVLGLHGNALFCGQGFTYGDESAIAEAVFSSTDWRHVCCTVDETETLAYVSGRRVTILNDTRRPLWPIRENAATVGAATGQSGWNGEIDEVRVSNVARSADWLRAEYLTMRGEFVSVEAPESVAE